MDKAVGLAAQLLDEYGHETTELVLVPSSGGVFEVDVDDSRVFSKARLKRHPEPGEISRAIGDLRG